jgi:ubiquitin-protein ligase
MADPRAIRAKRLTNEYNELMKINGSVIKIEPIGNSPYEQYKITYNIRTIISPTPTYRNSTVCTLTIPPSYPSKSGAPFIFAETSPPPWHVNWFKNGRWCSAYYDNNFNPDESLVNLVLRCARVLQFDPVIANPDSAANRDAIDFWFANKDNKRIIPCDVQPLPIVDASGRIILPDKPKPTIVINPAPQDKPKITIL